MHHNGCVLATPAAVRRRVGSDGTVDAAEFYSEYHGHPIDLLKALHSRVGDRPVIWLAGDSSLDNKHWFQPVDKRRAFGVGEAPHLAQACNGYDEVLTPKLMVKDVAYWVNRQIADEYGQADDAPVCINAAIEESTTSDRSGGTLLPQDAFIRDHIKENDVLILSVGGNDIALRPSPLTVFNMGALVKCVPRSCLGASWSHVPATAACCEDGGGCVSGCCLGCACGAPSCVGYFGHLFRNRVEAVARKLTARRKPRLVLVCMLYYLDEKAGGSWADTTLAPLGYNTDPSHLQQVIRKIFEQGTSKISIPGTTVLPIPMYEALDGKDTGDYVQRVEPSIQGGRKMAAQFLSRIRAASQPTENQPLVTDSP